MTNSFDFPLERISGVGAVSISVSRRLLQSLFDLALAATAWDDADARARLADGTADYGLLAHDLIGAQDGLTAAVAAVHGVIDDEHHDR